MNSFPSKEGPYPVRLIYETQEIDQICEDALRSKSLLPKAPEPIKVDLFLEQYFEVPLVYENLSEGIMGCTVFNSKGGVTGFMISSQIEEDGTKSAERRARSTIAHEGGHGLLHSRLFISDTATGSFLGPKASEKPGFMCRNGDIGAVKAKVYDGRWWEWQANRAIAGLLLPRRLVTTAIAPFMNQKSLVPTLLENHRNEAAQLVATTFDVNPAVARIRLEEMYPITAQLSL